MNAIFSKNREKAINRVVELPIESISPNPHQPRKSFGERELDALCESIRRNGILQPLTVRRAGEQRYELIAGERRLRAAARAGLSAVPCIIVEVSERNSAVLALVENIQRQELSFFEEAEAIASLIDFYGMTQEDAALRLGRSQPTIANKLRLLKLSPEERRLISEGGLTERHARALLRLPPELRAGAIAQMVRGSLNVSRSEALVERLLSAEAERASIRRRAVVFGDVRLFLNTINKAVETMQAAGIKADAKKLKGEGYVEYVVRIAIDN